MDLILCILALLLLLLPGIALWQRLSPDPPGPARAVTGVTFALALAVCSGYVLNYFSLDIFLMAWGVAAALAAFSLVRNLPSPGALYRVLSPHKWLLGLLLFTLLIRILPTFAHTYPRGWDPYFHLLLAQKILGAGAHISDWLPHETIPLNYPTGSHLLLAALSRVTQVPPHALFKLLLALFGALTVAQVFALVSVSTRERHVALLSAASYALLPAYGSLGYYRWGGLPNLMGMLLLLGALTTLARTPAPRHRLLLPAFFVGICLLNHHVLASAVLLSLILLGVLAALPGQRPRAWVLLQAALISLAPGALYFLPRLRKGYSVLETGLLQYGEPVHTVGAILSKVGHGYIALALGGAALLCWRAIRRRRSPATDDPPPTGRVLLLSCGALLLLFCIFEYGGRLLAIHLLGRPIAPFTPSRFLTDAISPMAIFPGLLLAHVLTGPRRTPALALALILLLSLENAPLYRGYFKPVVKPAQAAAYLWIRANTPPNTVVLDRFVHAAYISGRVASNTPIPTSELWSRATRGPAMEAVLRGDAPPASLKAPVILVSGAPRGRQLWRSEDGSVHVGLVHDPGR